MAFFSRIWRTTPTEHAIKQLIQFEDFPVLKVALNKRGLPRQILAGINVAAAIHDKKYINVIPGFFMPGVYCGYQVTKYMLNPNFSAVLAELNKELDKEINKKN